MRLLYLNKFIVYHRTRYKKEHTDSRYMIELKLTYILFQYVFILFFNHRIVQWAFQKIEMFLFLLSKQRDKCVGDFYKILSECF